MFIELLFSKNLTFDKGIASNSLSQLIDGFSSFKGIRSIGEIDLLTIRGISLLPIFELPNFELPTFENNVNVVQDIQFQNIEPIEGVPQLDLSVLNDEETKVMEYLIKKCMVKTE
jgi:hypothetical protein